MLRQETVLGQVKRGFAADLLILNKNPLEDVTILGEPENHTLAVIKDGRVYTSRWSKLPVDVKKTEEGHRIARKLGASSQITGSNRAS